MRVASRLLLFVLFLGGAVLAVATADSPVVSGVLFVVAIAAAITAFVADSGMRAAFADRWPRTGRMSSLHRPRTRHS